MDILSDHASCRGQTRYISEQQLRRQTGETITRCCNVLWCVGYVDAVDEQNVEIIVGGADGVHHINVAFGVCACVVHVAPHVVHVVYVGICCACGVCVYCSRWCRLRIL